MILLIEKKMMPLVVRIITLMAMIMMLNSCANPKNKIHAEMDQGKEKVLSKNNVEDDTSVDISEIEELPTLNPAISLRARMPMALANKTLPSWITNKQYSFFAENMSIRDALAMFARANQLNIYVDKDVTGKISVRFRGLRLKKAMEIILGSHGYYWEWEESLVHVRKLQTKTFSVNYLRLQRTTSGDTSSSIASQGGSDDNRAGSSSAIGKSDQISFWDELEEQIKSMISKQGRLVVNRLTGTVHITDMHDRITDIENYLNAVENAMHRQVLVEAKIFEVSLRDDDSLGIDWTQISISNIAGEMKNIMTTNAGLDLKEATATFSYSDKRFNTLVSALKEQGEVNIVSQPKIRAMNNQTATIKVGTDRTFFVTTKTTTTNASVTDVEITETAKVITEGVVLSVTPQVSADGWIMLDILPVITRITDTVKSDGGSTAPVLDIRQTATMVRVRNGEMVILGGLIQEEDSYRERRLPYLGAIPLLGWAFKGTYRTKIKKELVIFLTPTVVG